MRPFALLAAACCLLQLQAQELLPNGGFEQFTACPDSAGQIGRASGWSRPTAGTSDYFNACQQSIPPGFNVFIPGVPDNYFGHQPAHGGQGYAGFYCSDSVISLPNGNYKEYVSHPLATPMVPGEAYLVEFFVNLSDHSATPTHDIGALFSTEMPHRDDAHPLTELPQITPDASTLLDDSVGWTRIQACFIADSAYAFITIGSFPAAASGLLPEGTTSAAAGAAGMLKDGPTGFPPAELISYYYVDDVSVQHLPKPDLGPDLTICAAETLEVRNVFANISYVWSTGDTGPVITVDAEGSYVVQIADAQCPLTDTVVLRRGPSVLFRLPPDTVVDLCAQPHVLLDAHIYPANAEVTWSTGDTTDAILVDAAATYRVHGSADGFCAASTSITVIDTCTPPVYAPNAFTPDGDGINDTWRPVCEAETYRELSWSVFDRWGHVVFSPSGPDDAWDGTAAGRPLPVGIYAWRGRAYDTDTRRVRMLKGAIVLVR
jgi:gliding motility-associated-like protein